MRLRLAPFNSRILGHFLTVSSFFFTGFDTGPQFVFNLGGNRNFRVHNMNGGVPRRRPRAAGPDGREAEPNAWDTVVSLLPILFLFLFPLLTSLLSGDGGPSPAVPNMSYDAPGSAAQTLHRTTPKYKVDYYVDPSDVADWTETQFRRLDADAEGGFVRGLQRSCDTELRTRQKLVDEAQGWIFEDPEKMKMARQFKMMACDRMQKMRIPR